MKGHAVRVFECPQGKLNEEMVDRLLHASFSSHRDFTRFLGTLKQKDDEYIDMAPQGAGNCSWANTKSALLVLHYIFMRKNGIQHPQAVADSARVYHQFTRPHVRLKVAQQYLDGPRGGRGRTPSPDLAGKMLEKIRKPTKAEKEDHLPPEMKQNLERTWGPFAQTDGAAV